MNSSQISAILRQNPYTKRYFEGCVPADAIPQKHSYPYFIIVNTDPATKPGQHWQVIFVESKQKVEHFCSFGLAPNHHMKNFLNTFPQFYQNPKCIQAASSRACGLFCILYVMQRCRGVPRHQVVSNLQHMPISFLENLLL